ncbi:MAG TPA: hypothetical protein VKW70_04285 [Terriglobia bacterium]|nr:hypothetical protein [Terriglobia bacterium]
MKWNPLQSATATVTYAEFADGTQYGSDIQSAARWFADIRADATRFYKQAMAAYQAERMAGLEQMMDWKHEPATEGGRGAWLYLHQIEEHEGQAGLVTELTRLASLSPPNH